MDPIETYSVGQHAEWRKTVTETDVVLYAGITGDFNPVHVDAVRASESQFGQRIAHGMLSAGFVSAALAMKLPGPGSIYLSQSLRFTKPVYIGDTITATVTIRDVNSNRRRLTLDTTCTNQSGDTVLDGEAVILIPKVRDT